MTRVSRLSPRVTQGDVTETLGAKLRRLARSAEISNPLINPPWTPPPAWVASTPYLTGDVVSKGGNWYVSAGPGTSGTTGPSTTTNGNALSDGTTLWTYFGGASVSTPDPAAPAYSVTKTNPVATLPNFYFPVSFPGLFRLEGFYPSVLATSFWNLNTFNRASGSVVGQGGGVSFMTDAAKFAIAVTSNTPVVRIQIDNRYYSPTGITVGTGTTWLIFDFTATTGRRPRLVKMDGFNSSSNFAGVWVTAIDNVWAPPAQDSIRAAFISDSLMAGSAYGPMLAGGTVPQRVGRLLGWDDCWNFSTGGTGYVNPGAGPYYTFGQRVPEALTRNPDIWVFMGSTNDIGQTSAAITAAALSAFQGIRAGGSSAPIVVLGVWPLNNAGVSTVEAAVKAAVAQFADPLGKTFFIPIFADPVLPWVTGAWNNAANLNSANAGLMIAGDNTHPPDIGTAYLAERISRAIKTGVLPNIK